MRVAICVASRNAGGEGVVVVVGRKERGGDSGVGVKVSSVCLCVGGRSRVRSRKQAGKQARAQSKQASKQASESAPGSGLRESFGWVS